MVEVVQMSLKEADRYAVVRQVIERTMVQADAAMWLKISVRQAKTHRVGVMFQTPPTWSSYSSTAAYRHARFERDHWPSFAHNFIRYEHRG